MNVASYNPSPSKTMHRNHYQSSHSYNTPPPSYTTNAPRSHTARRKSKADESISTKRFLIRGFQFVSLLLCAYRLYEKHRVTSVSDSNGQEREERRREERRERFEPEYEEYDGNTSYGGTTERMYGAGSTVSGSENDYLGDRGRRRRERVRRIENRD